MTQQETGDGGSAGPVTPSGVEKDVLMFSLSKTFKEAIGVWSQSHNRSTADVCRSAIAGYIAYDLAAEQQATRRNRRYANAEERKQAQKDREKQKRKLTNQLLEAMRKGASEEELKRITESLRQLESQTHRLHEPCPDAL